MYGAAGEQRVLLDGPEPRERHPFACKQRPDGKRSPGWVRSLYTGTGAPYEPNTRKHNKQTREGGRCHPARGEQRTAAASSRRPAGSRGRWASGAAQPPSGKQVHVKRHSHRHTGHGPERWPLRRCCLAGIEPKTCHHLQHGRMAKLKNILSTFLISTMAPFRLLAFGRAHVQTRNPKL